MEADMKKTAHAAQTHGQFGDTSACEVLKLCPSCGGNAKISQDESGKWRVQCQVCKTAIGGIPNKELAVQGWNRWAL